MCDNKGLYPGPKPASGVPTLPRRASFGLADGGESPEELLHRADMAMYEAKPRHVPRLGVAS